MSEHDEARIARIRGILAENDDNPYALKHQRVAWQRGRDLAQYCQGIGPKPRQWED